MLQNISQPEHLQNFLQTNSFFNHLCVGMQSNAVASRLGLGMNSREYLFRLGGATRHHRGARLPRRIPDCKVVDIGMLTLPREG